MHQVSSRGLAGQLSVERTCNQAGGADTIPTHCSPCALLPLPSTLLPHARRELCKERQRSRQLRASYSDALTLLGQHQDSPAGSLPAVTSAHQDSVPAAVQAAQPGSVSSTEEQGLFAANNRPARLPQASRYTARAPAQSMQAGGAAGRYHRGSTTDTAVAADQRCSSSNSDAADRAAAASNAQTSPSKRAAAAQQQPGASAAAGSSDAAGGSPPKKHKQAASGEEPVSNQHQHPFRPPRPQPLTTQGLEGDGAGAAAAEAAGGACDSSNTRQQTRLLSKRPAQRFSPDPLAPDHQPLVRAARRLRTSDSSSDRSSNGSNGSKQGGNTSPVAADAGTTAAIAGQEGVVRLNVLSDAAAPLQQPAVVNRSSATSSRAATGQPGEVPPAAVQNRSAGLPPAPYPAPTAAPAAPSVQSGSGDGGCTQASSSSSSQRRSRLSAVTDSNALALVPVSTMRSSHDSRCGGAAAAQRQQSRAAERMSHIPEPVPEPEAAEPAVRGGSSSKGSKGSYRRKAAKAAQALAKTLKKMFITATTSSSRNADSGTARSSGSRAAAPAGSSNGGSGSDDGGSSRASRQRDADFRRSWQGPFFSSGSAARAAAAAAEAHRQSKDDTHAGEGRKGSSSAGRRWKPPKWARRYSGYSSSDSSSEDEADSVFDQDPFGPTFSPLRHNFSKHNPPHPSQQGSAAGGPGQSPFADPFGPAFSPLRRSMHVQPNQQQGGRQQQEAAAACLGDDGFGPGWLGID